MTLPYAEGELLARVRERGTVEVTYHDAGVHVAGRVVAVAGRRAARCGGPRAHAPDAAATDS